jgi:hypothetical protein
MWRAFCESLDGQGRKAPLFIFLILLACLGMPLFYHWQEQDVTLVLFIILVSLLVVTGVWTIVQWRKNRRNARTQRSLVGPLAFEEWRTARSKLVKNRR